MNKTEDEASTIKTQTIGPHDEAGFAPRDVLKEAEDGDGIYLEMDFYDHPFESVRGEVANVNEETDDEEMVEKTVQVEASGEVEMVNLGVTYQSGYVSLREQVRFVKHGEDDYTFAELDDLAMCKLTREVEQTGPYGEIVGKVVVEVECLTPRAEPELCDGWTEEIYLDAPARIEGDRLVLPGFSGECPNCGNSSFRVEGIEVMFHV